MPWSTRGTTDLRQESIPLVQWEDYNQRELYRRFDISPQVDYEWLARYVESGDTGLADRTRRPPHNPIHTGTELEQAAIASHRQHPAWGGHKINRRLVDLGWSDVPTPSTVTSVLH